MDKKNILTYQGLKKLEDELQELKVVRRKEVAAKIKEAREQGDLSAGNVQRISGSVAECNLHFFSGLLQIDINPCLRLCIFADVVHQIINNTPEMSAIRHNINRFSRLFDLKI